MVGGVQDEGVSGAQARLHGAPTPLLTGAVGAISLVAASCFVRLRQHKRQQEQERAEAGVEWLPLDFQPKDGVVFTTTTGTAIDPRSLNRQLDVLCRRAKLRQVRIHDLRHTCASLLLAEGVAVRTIMETLGHSNISMTLDTYAHVMETTLREAAASMDGSSETGLTRGPATRKATTAPPPQGCPFSAARARCCQPWMSKGPETMSPGL
jgi:hypothetical protein